MSLDDEVSVPVRHRGAATASPPITGPPLSYRSLLRVAGLPRLAGAALLGRIGIQMQAVALVLFALDRFHSPTIAGITVFVSVFPGLAVSPLAGALLDRAGRARLITLDYVVATGAMTLIVVLAATGALGSGLLIGIAAAASLTGPLSSAGTRSLFPVLVPRALWDRANALDSTGYVIAVIIGPPLAGVVAGLVSRPGAIIATAAVYAAAAATLMRLPSLPAGGPARASLVGDAWAGLVYVARHATLRGLAVSVSVMNLAQGIAIVALPVLVLDRFHRGPAVVGILWALVGISGAVSSFIVGRRDSEGRERTLLVVGMLGVAAGVAVLALASVVASVAVAAVAMLLYGAANGPLDIGLFSVRQRRTDAAWFGRAFAVSMSLNYTGVPIGSAIAGPLLGAGTTAALFAGAGFAVLATLLTARMIPARHAVD